MKKLTKTIEVAIMIWLCLGLVSAYNLTAGESFSFNLSESFEYFSIIGNSTPINITTNGLNVTITTNKYMPTDKFEIIFFNAEKEIIHYYPHGGGGSGTRTIYKDKNITKYIDKYVDKIIYKDKDIIISDEPKINSREILDWSLVGLMFVYLVGSLIRLRRK